MLGVAAVGVEAVAHHRLALDLEVGDDGHDRGRHLAEVDVGVGDVGADRRDDVADGDDTHSGLLQAAACRIWRLSSHQAMAALITFQAIPLMKAARYEPVMSNSTPPIHPPSAIPSTAVGTPRPTRGAASRA